MIRTAILTLLSCGLICSGAFAASQAVTLKNGTKVVGEVTKSSDGCEVKLPMGLTLKFAKDKIETISSAANPADAYKGKLAKVEDSNPDQHLELGNWAIENCYWDIAQAELKKVIQLRPEDEQASLLLRKAERNLEQAEQAGTVETRAATTATSKATPTADASGGPLISDDDIYRIRMYELKKDEQVSVEFRNKNVIDRFLEQMKGQFPFKEPGDVMAFKALTPVRKLHVILKELGKEDVALLDDILIKSDPKFMKDFRVGIWGPIVSQSCAQIKCHGGASGQGELKLFPGKGEKVEYTNFLIMSMWDKDGNRIIDRSDNESSLLLQHGLPESVAQYRHPKTLDTPLFPTPKSGNYKKVLAWIGELEGSAVPNYHTTYQPPVGRKLAAGSSVLGSASKPSTRPASKPATDEKDPFNK